MRKSTKEMLNQKTISNLEAIDFKNMLDYTTQIEEQNIAQELGTNIGELHHIHLKKFR